MKSPHFWGMLQMGTALVEGIFALGFYFGASIGQGVSYNQVLFPLLGINFLSLAIIEWVRRKVDKNA